MILHAREEQSSWAGGVFKRAFPSLNHSAALGLFPADSLQLQGRFGEKPPEEWLIGKSDVVTPPEGRYSVFFRTRRRVQH